MGCYNGCRHEAFRLLRAGKNSTDFVVDDGEVFLRDVSWVDGSEVMPVRLGSNIMDADRPVGAFARLEARNGELWVVGFALTDAGKAYAARHREFTVTVTVALAPDSSREIRKVYELVMLDGVGEDRDGRVAYVVGPSSGDVVREKDGGPAMTVGDVSADGSRVWCKWFVGSELHQGTFQSAALRCARPPMDVAAVVDSEAAKKVLEKAATVMESPRFILSKRADGIPVVTLRGEGNGGVYEMAAALGDVADDLGRDHLLKWFDHGMNDLALRQLAADQ